MSKGREFEAKQLLVFDLRFLTPEVSEGMML